jgi:ribosomal protein L31
MDNFRNNAAPFDVAQSTHDFYNRIQQSKKMVASINKRFGGVIARLPGKEYDLLK